VGLCLVLLTGVVFWPVGRYEFVEYDDNVYVTENMRTQKGLTWDNLAWALRTTESATWIPLTRISFMADYEVHGLESGGYHVANLCLHILNVLLLFAALSRMTGAPWRSACVAALFAIHPLHVESVAWVAERKDVLSTFFVLAALLAYARYVARPTCARYLGVLTAYALSLLAKPMMVTFPFVLLLLDYWPLGRWTSPFKGRLLWEKLPLIGLSVIASIITYFAQKHGGVMTSLARHPLDARISNALVSYARYLAKTFWPSDMIVLYPYPDHPAGFWVIFASAGLILAVSALCVLKRARHPALAIGWFWYLGTLVPVIGLVQVGIQSMADRYTYVPLIGIFIMVCWGLSDWRQKKAIFGVLAGAALAALAVTARAQVRHWENSETLFQHTLSLSGPQFVLDCNLGVALAKRGRFAQAVEHYERALRDVSTRPSGPQFVLEYNLGVALAKLGKAAPAAEHFMRALQDSSANSAQAAMAHDGLATALAERGLIDEAGAHFFAAVNLDRGRATAHNGLGIILARQGRPEQAAAHFVQALSLQPTAQAHCNLGLVYDRMGRREAAIREYRLALSLDPGSVQARRNLDAAFSR